MLGKRDLPANGGARTEKGTATPRGAPDPARFPTAVIGEADLQAIIDRLRDLGYTVIGPAREGNAIALTEIHAVSDLPRGHGDEQEAGQYRIHDRGDAALFGFAATPQSWKAILFPSREPLLAARGGDGLQVSVPQRGGPPHHPPYALIGVRSCDLHAIWIQDRVLLGRAATDQAYADRRDEAFIVAVVCSEPGGTCFCVSMGTGPDPDRGFDLALTEIAAEGRHRFVVRAGSERGADLLAALAVRPASDEDIAAAGEVVSRSAARMGRHLDTHGIREVFYENPDHPRWDDVASRCLSCTNCTLVCPTCFCVAVENVTDLTGESATRHRVWDSCFTSGHSHLPGGSVHGTIRSRYRQWLTHKLASWIDQFGTSGCVGCGRCITWCPAAIDITEEAAALRAPSGGLPSPATAGWEPAQPGPQPAQPGPQPGGDRPPPRPQQPRPNGERP